MFIQVESTPNPSSLKFLPGREVKLGEPVNFSNKASVASSPLAKTLFTIESVDAVFLGSDFITITKAQDADWELLKPEILVAIMDHFVAGKPVMSAVSEDQVTTDAEEEDELTKQIKELIETRVRPAVAQDGGDIIFHSFKDGVVKLELHGACSGCPSSSVTLKSGVENMLKYYVPEVISVEAIEGEH